ncbi:hypothetical protein AWB69_08710 [Caballeronia udeis]|uniref:Uncharacterized protein n=1 Tax=Caballeronia udeis TaxID=1232866 RepID=A0A158JU84_9BURK|nr:hypothetical protein AWB69_08710 [Caballeronia udeis]
MYELLPWLVSGKPSANGLFDATTLKYTVTFWPAALVVSSRLPKLNEMLFAVPFAVAETTDSPLIGLISL